MTPSADGGRRDTGSGSIWLLCLLLLLGAGAAALTAAGVAAAEQEAAQASADLAALRAADVLQHAGTSAEACAAAARLATVNRGQLTRCVITGQVATVGVVRAGRGVARRRARASSRAGPP